MSTPRGRGVTGTSEETPRGPIAVDAMGGDDAPRSVIEGARIAASEGIPVVLVGDPAWRDSLRGADIDWFPATESVGMDEEPGRAIRRKKDASVLRAAELVRDGRASAFVGAGNTGATMGAALLRIGRIRGVRRPAIAVLVPSPRSQHDTVLLDVGANAETSPEMTVQHAAMGAAYARSRSGVLFPTVALLNVGREAGKGPDRVRASADALSRPAWQAVAGARFVGHAEGRDLFDGTFDVVVTDGFTGNVVLKSMEGASTTIMAAVDDALGSSPKELAALRARFDPEQYGGAFLLGLEGIAVIAHGASSPFAVSRAIRFGYELAGSGVVNDIRLAVGSGAGGALS